MFFWALLKLWCPHAVEQKNVRSQLDSGLGTHCSIAGNPSGQPESLLRKAQGSWWLLLNSSLKVEFLTKQGPVLCLLCLCSVWYCRLLGWDFADQWWSVTSAWEAGISWLLPSSSPSWVQGSGYTMAPSVCLKQGNYAQKLLKEYKVVKSSEKCYNIACSAFNWILRACKFDSL